MKLAERDRPPVTDQAVEYARALIGVPLRRRGLNTTASAQAIRRWALSIGERNPLYLDHGYGRNSRYGITPAPPLWLHSVDDTVVAPRMPGLHAIYTGADWEFFHTVRVGDRITARARLIGVEERESRFAGRTVRQTGEIVYETPDGRLVARCVSAVDRIGRAEAAQRGLYMKIRKHRYDEDALLKIEDAYEAEVIRGSQVRYWEDTEPGESMPPVVKGPLTSEDIITFVCATHPVRTYGAQLRYRARHPLCEFYDVETGRFDAWDRALLDPEVAQQFGFSLPHDMGYQRICWLGNLLSNWGGDDSQLRRLNVKLIRPNLHGDTTYSHGKITERFERGAEHVARADVWCENQRGERTAEGYAEIALVSRSVP